jgi:hypothetical protein
MVQDTDERVHMARKAPMKATRDRISHAFANWGDGPVHHAKENHLRSQDGLEKGLDTAHQSSRNPNFVSIQKRLKMFLHYERRERGDRETVPKGTRTFGRKGALMLMATANDY